MLLAIGTCGYWAKKTTSAPTTADTAQVAKALHAVSTEVIPRPEIPPTPTPQTAIALGAEFAKYVSFSGPTPRTNLDATNSMVLAHSVLRDPRIADPDSRDNRVVLQTMITKALAQQPAVPNRP